MIANIAATDGMHRRHPFLHQGITPPKKTRLMTYEIEKKSSKFIASRCVARFFFFYVCRPIMARQTTPSGGSGSSLSPANLAETATKGNQSLPCQRSFLYGCTVTDPCSICKGSAPHTCTPRYFLGSGQKQVYLVRLWPKKGTY